MTVGEWLWEAENRLVSAGIESSRLEAQVLAAHVLLVDRSWLLAHPEAEFPDLAGENLLQRRELCEPLAYIIGKREFFGYDFAVRPGVLIPRQDTEVLVETAIETAKQFIHSQPLKILDVGFGSGAIAISLKLRLPNAEVTGVDVSELALDIATQNAERLGANVRLLLSDGFQCLAGETFDLIVSNPPYIANNEQLASEVVDFEPSIALFSGPTGLEFYLMLALEAASHLTSQGVLLLEVGHTQAEAVKEIFEQEFWTHVQTVEDLSRIQRVLEFQRPT
jgi:release factor glutamine methyltransferase